MFYSENLIEEVRMKNDIVDVISSYVKLQKREVHILDSARFIMKNHLPFQFHRPSRCIIVSDAEQEEMC